MTIKIAALILLLAALAATAFFLTQTGGIARKPDKENLLVSDLDKETIACLSRTPVPDDPRVGTYRFANQTSFADYFYRAKLVSVETISEGNCSFVKLNMDTEYFYVPFTLYLPAKMPSPGTEGYIFPKELAQHTDKKAVELMIRYGLRRTADNSISYQGVLGWQLLILWIDSPY